MRLTKLWMPAYLNGGDAAARKVFTPNTYSSRESNILQGTKELIRCRTFNYKGQEMPMLKHLCIGVKRNTALTLRIYFECVQDEEKIVVGWCGEHLRRGSRRDRQPFLWPLKASSEAQNV